MEYPDVIDEKEMLNYFTNYVEDLIGTNKIKYTCNNCILDDKKTLFDLKIKSYDTICINV